MGTNLDQPLLTTADVSLHTRIPEDIALRKRIPVSLRPNPLCLILHQGVTNAVGRARQRSRRADGSAMAWSWLTLSPRPIRVAVAVDNPRFAVYLTVLPAGVGSPPSHRPMYGCHILSRVLAGEVEQVGEADECESH